MVANADAVEAIICGIGINLNHQEEDFSDMIRHRATSIRLHHSEEINRYQFLKRLIEELKSVTINFLTLHLKRLEMNTFVHLIFGIVS